MTGIYSSSQEDKIKEIDVAYYNFPSYLNVNSNFIQLIKFMDYQQLSKLVYSVAIIADEKNDIDTRHWASDELNVFLNTLLHG